MCSRVHAPNANSHSAESHSMCTMTRRRTAAILSTPLTYLRFAIDEMCIQLIEAKSVLADIHTRLHTTSDCVFTTSHASSERSYLLTTSSSARTS